MTDIPSIPRYVAAWPTSPFATTDLAPWAVVHQIERLIREALRTLGPNYRVEGEFAVHRSATIEPGAVLKGPAIVGPRCFVASGAYLRGGTFLDADCAIGPGAELKSSFLFAGSKLAHLNFVGDSIVGSNVNIEAGAIVANYRNELPNKAIRILHAGEIIETGVHKFGSLIGDGTRIGANAVIAPGALIAPGSTIGRLQLVDQHPHAATSNCRAD